MAIHKPCEINKTLQSLENRKGLCKAMQKKKKHGCNECVSDEYSC